jgi:hypothetical protein
METARSGFSMVALQTGAALAVGGSYVKPLTTTVVYHPSTDTWGSAASIPAPRLQPASALLRNGSVLVVGGAAESSGHGLTTALLYHPETDVWVPTVPMDSPRVGGALATLLNGTVLAAGGDWLSSMYVCVSNSCVAQLPSHCADVVVRQIWDSRSRTTHVLVQCSNFCSCLPCCSDGADT